MLFGDDIVLVDESRDDMNEKLKRLWEALESCSTKAKYINPNLVEMHKELKLL